MNRVLLLIAILLTSQATAQKRYEVANGHIDFTSNAPLELINASSEKVKGVIDANTKQFAFIVSNGSFKGFNSELQRQHFNEKYMESDKYYQSSFVGTLTEPIDFNVDGVYKVNAKGTLLVHGKKQSRIISGTVIVSNGKLTVDANFIVPLADHNIAIPKIVNQKIATEIRVTLRFILEEQDKK